MEDMRRNVFPKFIEICMEPPCWCPPRWAPTWRPEISRNICHWWFFRFLLQKREFISRRTQKRNNNTTIIRKGVPPAPGICPTSGHWIFVAKFLGIFQCDDFFEEISKLPTNKDLAFVTVPLSLTLRWHLRRHFLKYRGKRQVNRRGKGISRT